MPLASVLLLSLAGIVVWLPAPVLAQTPSTQVGAGQGFRHYEIPAGTLGQALSLFATQAGVLLYFEPGMTAGLSSAGLQGSYGLAEGFASLLQGSGLAAVPQRDGGYTLERQPAASVGVARLDAVSVVGQGINPKDDVYRAPQSINVLTRDDIERFRGTSVGDIFQGIPGVLVGENRNSGGLDVNIRGMQGQGRVPVLVDGARQETTVYRGYAGVASRSYVDPDLIGGVRIEKGPTMDAAGTGATGGLVSMRTLNADDILAEGERFGVRMRGTAIGNNSGSPSEPGTRSGLGLARVYRTDCRSAQLCAGDNDLANIYGSDETLDRPGTFHPKSWAGSLALAGRWDALELVAAYAERHQGNYYAGKHGPAPTVDVSERYPRGFWVDVQPKIEGATRFRAEERIVNSNFENKSLLLKGRVHLPADQQLELSYLRYHSVYGELMPSQLIWLGNVHQTENSRVTAHTYSARYQWQPMDNRLLDLAANIWHTRTQSLNRNYSDTTNLPSDDEIESYRRWGMDVSNTMRFDMLGPLQLRYGVAAQVEDVSTRGSGSRQSISADNSLLFGRAGDRNEYSMFTALQWKPLSSVTLDAGVRYTHFRTKDDKQVPVYPGSQYCVDDNGDGQCDSLYADPQRGGGSAPLASLTWEPLDGWQLYARYAEALRMPSLFESTSGNSVSLALDTRLKPEHTRNREVGINFMRDGVLGSSDALRLKLAYFRNHTKNYLTRTYPNTWEDTSTGLNGTVFRMRNIDSVSFNGMEVSGSYDAGMVFMDFGAARYNKIETCHTGVYRTYSCTDYGISASYINNMIPPNWHAGLTLGTRWFEQRLTLGMRGTFMGKRNSVPEYDNQGVNDIFAPPVAWHAYKIFDLFASWQVNDHLKMDFNIDNLTDRYYLDALSLGLVPAPGRTARLGMTLQF